MNLKLKCAFVSLVILLFFAQCHTAPETVVTVAPVVVPAPAKPVIKKHHHIVIQAVKGSEAQFDSIITKLTNYQGLSKRDMVLLGITDTIYNAVASQDYPASMITSCEKTAQLNDSIFYSILSAPDAKGSCNYSFIVTIDKKNKKGIVVVYLNPACSIDSSANSYETYQHTIIADTIHVAKTIFYKKNGAVDNTDASIDHTEMHKTDYVIMENGEIELSGEN